MKEVLHKIPVRYQIIMAYIFALVGVALLFMSFWVQPTGVIDASVIAVFGNITVLIGSIMHLDLNYRKKYEKPNGDSSEPRLP